MLKLSMILIYILTQDFFSSAKSKGFQNQVCLQAAAKACWQDILEQLAIREEVWVGGSEIAHAHMTHTSCECVGSPWCRT